MNRETLLKRIPEIGAFAAATLLAQALGLSIWQWIGLWIAFDLMTATGVDLKFLRK
ncbi:hypothetical protein [Vreelandella populi]|uniref:hypothetical protein n=1 Tax=Vreelandella populi TaxID=2498858 RepID=UPI00163C0953|nr:hypothetical protein [Halomonas populi]